jgi:hypothetical protein
VETDLIRMDTAVYVDRTNTGEFSMKSQTNSSQSPIQTAIAIQSNGNGGYFANTANPITVQPSRSLMVRVPAGFGPGSVLSVAAPDGSLLSVSIFLSNAVYILFHLIFYINFH